MMRTNDFEPWASAGIDFSAKTFLISEVVLAYLTAECSTNVIRWIAAKFRQCLFVEFEQFNPTSTFGHVMTQHFKKIRSPIQTIEHLPTIQDRLDRFKNAGFMHFGTGSKRN
jgi:O-methyltransferase involved in polyketide biosynthesis